MQSIIIPDSTTSIGKYAFNGCSNLQYNEFDNAYYLGNSENPYVCLVSAKTTNITSCIINENTKLVCYDSFYDCDSLVSLTLPFVGESETKNTYLGYLFGAPLATSSIDYVPQSLKTIIVTNTTTIGAYAFFCCRNITDITISSGVVSIGNNAFTDCDGLTHITLPNTITSIGSYAFYNCDGLTKIVIPNGVTSIGGDAFTSCANLTDITIPSSVKRIGAYAFSSCWNLVNVYITDIAAWCNISFGNYGANPFGYDDKRNNHLYLNNELVTDLIIPEGVTTIPLYAFHAIDLKSVIIPSTVTSIGESAFADCKQLSSVSFAENSQLSTISTRAFYYCKALSSITIPSTVVSIGSNVFSSCDALYTVTFESAAGWWYASSSSETSGTDISSADLEDTVAAATLLKFTYKSYYWMKS